MPQVHFVKKARKDNPSMGIKRGDSYFWWKFRFGGMRVSKEYPKPAQLTQSEFKGNMYGVQEEVEAAVTAFRADHDFEAFADAVENAAEQVRGYGDECQEKFDNIPEQLQSNSAGELLQTRIDQCGSIADELENAAQEVRDAKPEESEEEPKEAEEGEESEDDKEEEAENAIETACDAVEGVSWDFE